MPMLLPNWRALLRRAWSVRFLVALIALELLGVWLTVRGTFSDDPRLALYFQLAGASLGIAAFIARLTYQQGLSREH
jgi:hypothetical protein